MKTTRKYTIEIDFAKQTKIALPQFIQGDTNVLEFTVIENGIVSSLADIGRVVVNFKRPDKRVISRLLVPVDDALIYELGAEEMETQGLAELELQFYSVGNTQRLSTTTMRVQLMPNIGTDAITDADESLTLLQSLFIEVEDTGDYALTQGDYAKAQGDAVDTKVDTAVSAKVPEAVDEKVGVLENLQTAEKASVVGAVNEVSAQLAQNTKEFKDPYLATQKNTNAVRPLVTFIDDDGKLETFNILKPIFDSKGEKFSFAVSSKLLSDNGNVAYMSKAQINQLITEGHELTAHGQTHVHLSTNLSEIKGSLDDFKSYGMKCENNIYPGGAYTQESIRENRKHFRSGVSVERGINTTPIRTHALKRYAVGTMWSGTEVISGTQKEDGTLASYKAMVDKAISENGWLICMLHTWDTPFDATQQQYVSEMIDYIQLKNVDIVTLNEGLDIYSNRLDIGDVESDHFLISADGKVKNPEFDKVSISAVSNSGITSSSPIETFPQGKISTTTFPANIEAGFPVANAGTLITYQLKDEYYGFQYWHPYNVDEIHYRRWDWSTDTWKSWVKILDSSQLDTIPISSIESVSGISNTSLIGSFPQGKISTKTFSSNSLSGFPFSDAGTLVTYQLKDQYYGFQFWYPYNADEYYFRRWDWSTSKWGLWMKADLNPKMVSISLDVGVINANSFKDVQITYPDLTLINGSTDVIVMSPRGGLENGLMYNVHLWTNKVIVLRLYNSTAAAITPTARYWNIKVLK